jgi:hypothetical protein
MVRHVTPAPAELLEELPTWLTLVHAPRLDQVRRAYAARARTAPEVVADVDRSLWGAAELSVRAAVAHLERESEGGPPRLDPP